MGLAAQRHLERFIVAERGRAGAVMALLRLFGVATLVAVAATVYARGGEPFFEQALWIFGPYSLAALGLLALARRYPGLTAPGLAVALLDVPIVVLLHLVAEDNGRAYPGQLGLLCALIGLSAMTLSRRLIVVTALAASLGLAFLLHRANATPEEQLLVLQGPFGTMVVCLFLVSRVRGLVADSRRDDLLGKYILGERIGAGGMAEVFKATYSPEGGFERAVRARLLALPPEAAPFPDGRRLLMEAVGALSSAGAHSPAPAGARTKADRGSPGSQVQTLSAERDSQAVTVGHAPPAGLE